MKRPEPRHPQGWLPWTGVLLPAALGQLLLVQRQVPWTLWAGAFCFALAGGGLVLLLKGKDNGAHPEEFSSRWELLLFGSIFLLGLFLRLYRLDQFPAGIFTDEGCEGWAALRILREGWRPFEGTYGLAVINPSIYYFLALWFKFFHPSQTALFSASVFLGLAAFPFAYWAFRQLAGPTTALIGLFFIAVMRWHLTYSRDAHPAIEILVYMTATLALWLQANRSRKAWVYALAGSFFGLGFYSYQAYRPFALLMMLYAVYELWTRRKEIGKYLPHFALFFLVAAMVALPVAFHLLSEKGLEARDKNLMAFPAVYDKGGVPGVLRHLLQFACTFNRQGDSWFIHNLPDHPMLDPVMGLLFVLGFFYALLRIRHRPSFYAVTGFCLMSLPGLLSNFPSHGSRLLGTIPFIAFIAADFLALILAKAASFSPRIKAWKTWGLAVLLGLCAAQNFHDYFDLQAKDPDCWRAEGGAEASWAGNSISRYGTAYSYVLCSHYFGSYAIQFLAFDLRDQMFEWKLPSSAALPGFPPDKGVCLLLEEGQTGVLDLFEGLYPGGQEDIFRDLNGHAISYMYRIPAEVVAAGRARLKLHPLAYGLKGSYSRSTDPKARPLLTQVDPVLDFTFRDDFPLSNFPPLYVHWTGNLRVPRAGLYRFLVLTTDTAGLVLDGKTLLADGNKESGEIYLKKGFHGIHVFFQKSGGKDAAFDLMWKMPEKPKYETIPYYCLTEGTAFRRDTQH